ncbi:response regulator [Microbacterium sp. Mu-80]|uniref:Response regulator n=1 Tax=Microbacterium bandirmense TaxID=3122050 RepID=A0ABU8LG25_9MICO
MTVSIEVITIVASAATLLVALISGFGWVFSRMDARFAQQDTRIEARFAGVETRLTGLERELTEVKIAVARIEGPPRRFIEAR